MKPPHSGDNSRKLRRKMAKKKKLDERNRKRAWKPKHEKSKTISQE